MQMDETFHGHNASEGAEPSREVTTLVTRMHCAHAAHGDFAVDYGDVVLNCGNGRVWADWVVTGVSADALAALPYIGWFSQRHRLPLKVGWLELQVRDATRGLRPYRVASWYEASAIPVSEFFGADWRGRAWCAALPDEAALTLSLRLSLSTPLPDLAVVVRGASTLGEEAGSPFDSVNGTVGACEPLPSRLDAAPFGNGLVIRNVPADLAARLECGGACEVQVSHDTVEVLGRDRSLTRERTHFELHCPLAPDPGGEVEFRLILRLDDKEVAAPAPAPPGPLPDAARAWRRQWRRLEAIATPDARLTAGLKRAPVYAASLLAPITGAQAAAACLCDHVSWPVDCARDTFHIASALLCVKPELARRHLAFLFLDAIPKAGAGKSYVGTGESRGHHDARLLDLAGYPLLELWRYWRATADVDFVALPQVRETALRIVDQVAAWQDPVTRMLTSTERSSDERCVFPCFVPGAAMFVVCLEHVAEMCGEVWAAPGRAERCRELAEDVRRGIAEKAVVDDPEFGPMFAFEVDPSGEALLYDHADMPNLLSLARLGFCAPADPVFRNTIRFAYSPRNQGYGGTADGKYGQLCDGSKTMPFSPWPLGALGQLMSGAATPRDAARLLDWLRDALTPALQLPEICDKHTAKPVQRYWFGWPTAMLFMAYVETICGLRIGREIRVEPLVPEGWAGFVGPRLSVRGHDLAIEVSEGVVEVRLDGRSVEPAPPGAAAPGADSTPVFVLPV